MNTTMETTTTTTETATEIDISAVPQRKLKTAVWDLSTSGSGTVTYHMFRLPGASDDVWPDALPGALCEYREKGGTGRASERKASSMYAYDPLPLGTQKIEIVQRWSHGSKAGSTKSAKTLVRYERNKEGKILSVWE